MQEIWKEVEGYAGLYEVSNLGRVRGVAREVRVRNRQHDTAKIRERMLSMKISNCGYLMCCLSKNGVDKRVVVHRLVAKAFLPHSHKKNCVNHINGVKTDNRQDNLEWVTNKENMSHAARMGLVASGESNGNSKLDKKTVLKIRASHIPRVVTFDMLAKKYNITKYTIAAIIQRKIWKHI